MYWALILACDIGWHWESVWCEKRGEREWEEEIEVCMCWARWGVDGSGVPVHVWVYHYMCVPERDMDKDKDAVWERERTVNIQPNLFSSLHLCRWAFSPPITCKWAVMLRHISFPQNNRLLQPVSHYWFSPCVWMSSPCVAGAKASQGNDSSALMRQIMSCRSMQKWQSRHK